jgi:DNA-directed RNA polymerase subunit RPC12/RpoP
MTETKKDTRPRYPGTCPYCGHRFIGCLSILQQDFGMYENGVSNCLHCKKLFWMIFDPNKKEFHTKTWEEFLENVQQKGREILKLKEGGG